MSTRVSAERCEHSVTPVLAAPAGPGRSGLERSGLTDCVGPA